MKKLIIIILISVITITTVKWTFENTNNEVKASECLIKIDSNNFPSPLIRYQVLYGDLNKDGYLSKSEIKKIKSIGIDYHGEVDINREYTDQYMKGGVYYREGVGIIQPWEYEKIDCKGLQLLTNLQKLQIYGMENFEYVYKLKNLKELWIEDGNEKNYKIYKLKKLKNFRIESKGIKKISFGKKSKIEKINMKWAGSKNTIDFSNLKYLKKFTADLNCLKKIKFGKKNKKLKSIYLCGDREFKNKMKTLDLSKLKNLRKLTVEDMPSLKKVYLPKKNKLKKTKAGFREWFGYGCVKLKKKKIIYK